MRGVWSDTFMSIIQAAHAIAVLEHLPRDTVRRFTTEVHHFKVGRHNHIEHDVYTHSQLDETRSEEERLTRISEVFAHCNLIYGGELDADKLARFLCVATA